MPSTPTITSRLPFVNMLAAPWAVSRFVSRHAAMAAMAAVFGTMSQAGTRGVDKLVTKPKLTQTS